MTTIASGVVRSSLLAAIPGLVHGFTTRELGSMAGSLFPRDEQLHNRATLESAIGMPLVKPSQVHSADVVLIEGGAARRLRLRPDDERPAEVRALERTGEIEADALVTRDRGVALSVAVADCVPVLVATTDGWIGAAHAGWEGTTRSVVGAMLGALAKGGARLGGARAAIGPSIGPCCYEIDAARAGIVRERLGRRADRVLAPRGARYLLDLWLAIRLQLADAGVDTVDALDACTKDEVGTYFSHRGEDGKAGRGLAFIGWRPA